jgi:hypothetical protein
MDLTIFFIHSKPWTKQDEDRFGIRQMRDVGLDVRLLVASPFSLAKTIASARQIFVQLWGRRRAGLVIPLFRLTYASLLIFQMLHFLRVPFYYLLNASQPQSGMRLVGRRTRRLPISRLINGVLTRVPCWLLFVSPARGIVIDGTNVEQIARKLCPPSSDKTKLIYSHSLDFARVKYLSPSQQTIGMVSGPYAVFLDQAVDCHPDFYLNGFQPPVTSQYKSDMCDFFSALQAKFGFDVVIATHPKSPDDRKFGEYRMIKGQTDWLIKNADLVIGHFSTAIGLAVIMNKPICIVQTSELEREPWTKFAINAFARELDIPVQMATNVSKSDFSIEIADTSRFKKYIDKYIRHPASSYDAPWWEGVVIDWIYERSKFNDPNPN